MQTARGVPAVLGWECRTDGLCAIGQALPNGAERVLRWDDVDLRGIDVSRSGSWADPKR